MLAGAGRWVLERGLYNVKREEFGDEEGDETGERDDSLIKSSTGFG
jgi:hypothetical protein